MGLDTEFTDDEITAFIEDPAKIQTHDVAVHVMEVLDEEISNIQAQIDAAQIESNAKPLSADRVAWLRRASYAAAMRRRDYHKIYMRDKEIRHLKGRGRENDAAAQQTKQTANLVKQKRLMTEADARRLSKQVRAQELTVEHMRLANQRRELEAAKSYEHRFVMVAKRLLPVDIYRQVCDAASVNEK